VKRLGMTTVGMPGHGFTFPVEGIVPVIFSSMRFPSFPCISASTYQKLNFPFFLQNFLHILPD
jgi:hypothetical protein